MIEKERKYLFKGDINDVSHLHKVKIVQGYFINTPSFEARVRIYNDDEAYITTKQTTNKHDERIELEEFVSVKFAKSLLNNCTTFIRKTRFYYNDNITIDKFHDVNLILVEIEGELPETLPSFCGEDVTDNPLYKNKNLAS